MSGTVKLRKGSLYLQQLTKYATNSLVLQKLQEFFRSKMNNPMAAFGSSDKPNPKGTPMQKLIPKLRHAHLTQDVSIFYTVSGADPTLIQLYGIMSHAEAGTGQPVNHKRQQGLAKQMSNQVFETQRARNNA